MRVGWRNIPAAQEWNVKGREKSWGNAIPLRAFVELRIGVDLAFGMKAILIHVAAQGNLACGGRRLNTRKRAQTLHGVLEIPAKR